MDGDEHVLPRESQLPVSFGGATQLHIHLSEKFISILYFKANHLVIYGIADHFQLSVLVFLIHTNIQYVFVKLFN